MLHSWPLIAVAIATPLISVAADESLLQSRLQQVLSEERLTGAAWVLVVDGEIRTGAAGIADAAQAAPFLASHRFHVGSVAKAVLATGVLRLATEDRIDLDRPVTQYLPAIEFDNPWSATHPVTVRHLLDHTAGLSDARLQQMFSIRATPDQPLAGSFVTEDFRVRSRPGSRLSYSNVGYGLLGLLIEAVTGSRYERYLDTHLLAPLGMRDSTFHFTTQIGAAADDRLAWGHLDVDTPYPTVPVALRPAAQFTTTAHDLGLFLRFVMGDGRIDGEIFIAPTLMRARGHAHATEAAVAGLDAGYALGLSRRDRYGAIGYCHSGNVVGFVALICAYPDSDRAFALSVNTDSETADYDRVFGLLAAELVRPPADPHSGVPAGDAHEWNGWYALQPVRFQQFAYLDAVFGNVAAHFDGETLTLVGLPGDAREFTSRGRYLFAASGRVAPSHVLMRNASGERSISDGYRSYAEVSRARVVALWLSLAAGAVGLVWFFFAGAVALWRRSGFWPFAGVFALALPLPFFLGQPFMALGDPTIASILLAIVTGLLPITMLIALWRSPTRSHRFFALCVLQWCAVLIVWDMLPLVLWR